MVALYCIPNMNMNYQFLCCTVCPRSFPLQLMKIAQVSLKFTSRVACAKLQMIPSKRWASSLPRWGHRSFDVTGAQCIGWPFDGHKWSMSHSIDSRMTIWATKGYLPGWKWGAKGHQDPQNHGPLVATHLKFPCLRSNSPPFYRSKYSKSELKESRGHIGIMQSSNSWGPGGVYFCPWED